MADSIFYGSRDLIAEQFGYELTRYTFGREAELRRLTSTDKQVAKAIELLQAAQSPEELFALAGRTN